jgi:hypothetical protein
LAKPSLQKKLVGSLRLQLNFYLILGKAKPTKKIGGQPKATAQFLFDTWQSQAYKKNWWAA